MRYLILKPAIPTDPRGGYSSLEDLRERLPVVMEADAESSAAALCRIELPDFIAMPVPVKVGSGEFVLLGLIESIRVPFGADRIPFVMFVQAIAENDYDRRSLKKNPNPFSRGPWKAPVLRPSVRTAVYKTEIRASDLPQPTHGDMLCGRSGDGRLTFYCELNGVAISIAFDDPNLNLVLMSGLRETVASDDNGAPFGD